MSDFKNFIDFYDKNIKILLSDELRPAKSITRNIITGISPFINYYNQNHKLSYDATEISRNILCLNADFTSTTNDNIRNMEELKFLTKSKDSNKYKLTRNFIDFVNSGLTIKEYLLQELRKISSVNDITMFYNCILCLLREGIIYGKIINYPDSKAKFIKKVPDKSKRIDICKKVYELYGFKGLRNVKYGDYTPNAIYRFASTCLSLNLIKKMGYDEFGFTQYEISNKGLDLLNKLNANLANDIANDVAQQENDKNTIFDDIYDQVYLAEINSTKPDEIIQFIDLPLPLANTFIGDKNIRRDPKKGANAKKRANYMCEFDNSHRTFATKDGNQYVEAHHLIPMNIQKRFFYNLDVEANIVALCSQCHDLLHHGTSEQKKVILKKLYEERIERLKACGLYLSLDDLISIYK